MKDPVTSLQLVLTNKLIFLQVGLLILTLQHLQENTRVVSLLYLPPLLLFRFRGTFRLEQPDGSAFDVRIPPFSLESKEEETDSPKGT